MAPRPFSSDSRDTWRRSASPSDRRPPHRSRDSLPSETGVGSGTVGRSTHESRDSQQQLDNRDLHTANNAAAPSMHQSQASQQQSSDRRRSTSNNPPIDLNRSLQEILPTLQTTYESIYQMSRDGTTHQSPATLRGVPVSKLTEDSAYWDPSWSSLDEFLAQESNEERKKIRSRNLLKLNPANKRLVKRCKVHMDNMSKHKKIREIFGHDSPYHPSQLVNKRHMPPRGLCQKELMYRLACRVSDFICLQKQGHLRMDPWDFIRWRLSTKLDEILMHPGETAKPFIRTAIYRLCDQSMDGNRYEDPIMRDAVLISADTQSRLGVFNKSVKRVANGGQSINLSRAVGNPRTTQPGALPRRQSYRPTAAQHGMQARRERRARYEASGSHWQGINHYRAQRDAMARLEEQQDGQGSPPQPRPQPRTQESQTVRREPRATDPAGAANWPGITAHRTQMAAAERARLEREEHGESRSQADRERRERRERAAEGFRRAREEQDREIGQARQGRRPGEPPGDVWLGSGHVFAQLAVRRLRDRDQNDAARERTDRERQARASESTRRGRDEVQQYRRERRGYY
ncbi:hypothetical protein TOPH_04566 [Tolypocladium ophioglossoides CBS 100239]|uniref:Uncharacterized protein n=1 Tax=Tolypocladium ophioglossoides (strain CBS 100239) TaxID=1163406 RepID=A0A0L0N9Y9_TOLOC|nr:hypothetical protein TOPH_04566 [Tolypocladium ophioglossoides CBS 100239]